MFNPGHPKCPVACTFTQTCFSIMQFRSHFPIVVFHTALYFNPRSQTLAHQGPHEPLPRSRALRCAPPGGGGLLQTPAAGWHSLGGRTHAACTCTPPGHHAPRPAAAPSPGPAQPGNPKSNVCGNQSPRLVQNLLCKMYLNWMTCTMYCCCINHWTCTARKP